MSSQLRAARRGGAPARDPFAAERVRRGARGDASALLGLAAAPAPASEPLDPPDVDRARLAALLEASPTLGARVADLDPWQQHAVLSTSDALLVRAQVGSGKTTVLTLRVLVAHLLDAVPLERIAVLTFTNRAANELTERIQAGLGRPLEERERRWLGTFHGVARRLLAESLPVEQTGRTATFDVLDASALSALHDELIAKHDLTIKYRKQLPKRLQQLEETGEVRFRAMRADDDLLQLAERTEAALRERDAMTFADLLRHATALLDTAPDRDARSPALLVVDELQDCNLDQLDLLAAWGRDSAARRFAVGDPNQTIYSWRGSEPAVFDVLGQRWSAETLRLPMNYRSTEAILACSRAYLRGRGADTWLRSGGGRGGEPVRVFRWPDPRLEAAQVALAIGRSLAAGRAPQDIAVLVRYRKQIPPLAEALVAAGVPIRVHSPLEDPCAPALAWVADLLRAALMPTERRSALRRLLTDETFGLVRAADLPGLAEEPTQTPAQTPALDALLDALAAYAATEEHETLAAGVRWLSALRPFADLIEGTDFEADAFDAGAFDADAFAAALELDSALRPTRSGYARDIARVQGALATFAEHLAKQWRVDAALDAFGAAPVDDDEPPVGGQVTLLTAHAAKGLEWDEVYVAGVNDGVFPMAGALRDPRLLAEERRLFFVALTRAREGLSLSWAGAPELPRAADAPSPFLAALPAEHCLRHDLGVPLDVSATPDVAAAESVPATESLPATESVPTAEPWPVDAQVRHRRYGDGVIVARDDKHVVARFERVGEKRFRRGMVPLEPV